jgi:broad specificity phosphatase PhoE
MSPPSASLALVHIIRHGEALHNVQRGYPHRDPPLTEAGMHATKQIALPACPDLIIISPMTRTIQTAISMFPHLEDSSSSAIPVQIWPDLREANDAVCNKGCSRAEIQAKFPRFDFSECLEHWDYACHTVIDATERAQRVRQRVCHLSATFKNIAIICHRGIIAYLVQGRRFNPAEVRSYRFAIETEAQDKGLRRGLHCDLLEQHDFGPTLLLLHDNPSQILTPPANDAERSTETS